MINSTYTNYENDILIISNYIKEGNILLHVIDFYDRTLYYYNEKLHRELGPAIEFKASFNKFLKQNMWFYNGIEISNVDNIKDFRKKVNLLILK